MATPLETPGKLSGDQFISDLGKLANLAREASKWKVDSEDLVYDIAQYDSSPEGAVDVIVEARRKSIVLDNERARIESTYLGVTAVVSVLDVTGNPIVLNRVTNNVYDYARPVELDFRTPWKKYGKSTLTGSVGYILDNGSFRIDKLPNAFSRFSQSFHRIALLGLGGDIDTRDNYQVFPFDKDGNARVQVTFEK